MSILKNAADRDVKRSQTARKSTKTPKPAQKVFGTSSGPSRNKVVGTNR